MCVCVHVCLYAVALVGRERAHVAGALVFAVSFWVSGGLQMVLCAAEPS